MKAFTRQVGALNIIALPVDDDNADVTCPTERCNRMALQRVTIAGHPAGYLCTTHAREWVRLWRELTEEPQAKPAPVRMAA